MPDLVKVKYIGKAPWIVTEYNGKRYMFSREKPVLDIPQEVLTYIKASQTDHAVDIIVVTEPKVNLEPQSEPVIAPKPKKKAKKKR